MTAVEVRHAGGTVAVEPGEFLGQKVVDLRLPGLSIPLHIAEARGLAIALLGAADRPERADRSATGAHEATSGRLACPAWCSREHPTTDGPAEVQHEAGDFVPAELDVQCSIFRFDDIADTGVEIGPTYVQLGFTRAVSEDLAADAYATLRVMARELAVAAELIDLHQAVKS